MKYKGEKIMSSDFIELILNDEGSRLLVPVYSIGYVYEKTSGGCILLILPKEKISVKNSYDEIINQINSKFFN